MKKSDVIKALGNYYALEKFSLSKLVEVYRSNREKYPSLDLDKIFEILAQPSERLSTTSLERSLRIKFSVVYSTLQAQKSQFENQGKSCPGYLSRCMKMIEELSGQSSVDESPTASVRTLTL